MGRGFITTLTHAKLPGAYGRSAKASPVNSPLQLISGVVSDLKIHSGEEEFIRSAGQQVAGIGAAAGLAVEGLAGTAVGASIAATSAGDSVEFFSCKVGGQSIKGRFSKASFKEGDELNFVIDRQVSTQLAMALAAKRVGDAMLWMVPHCSRGKRSHASYSTRLFIWITFSLLVLIGSFFGMMDWRSNSPFDAGFTVFWISLHTGISIIFGIYFSVRFYRQWLPIARQAEQIFAALGYPDPSRVDLPRDHMRYCKANGIKWPYLTDGPWIYHYLDPR